MFEASKTWLETKAALAEHFSNASTAVVDVADRMSESAVSTSFQEHIMVASAAISSATERFSEITIPSFETIAAASSEAAVSTEAYLRQISTPGMPVATKCPRSNLVGLQNDLFVRSHQHPRYRACRPNIPSRGPSGVPPAGNPSPCADLAPTAHSCSMFFLRTQ